MLEALRLWLNGNREYWTGVVLYAQCNPDTKLLELMQKQQTDFTSRRLKEELLQECNRLKALTHEATKSPEFDGTKTIEQNTSNNSNSFTNSIASGRYQQTISTAKETCANQQLYQSCLNEANTLYKAVMNDRAVLFNMAKPIEFEDVNRPDLVQKRSALAVSVALNYIRVSKLYDRADYVLKHGVLPNEEAEHDNANDMEALPDELVKATLDNLRKNINKIKKREQTPERIALLQQHDRNLKKLEERWDLLRPTK